MFKNIRTFAFLFQFKSASFCGYTKYLNAHVINVINSRPELQACLQDFAPIMEKYSSDEQQIRKKLNMIFNVHCLQPPISQYKQKLVNLIKEDKIIHQSELDRVIQWVTKNIKYDKNISIEEILKEKDSVSLKQFEEQLKKIEQGEYKNQTIPEICKKLRAKFISIESKEIYQRVKNAYDAQSSNSSSSKLGQENSVKYFWDKLYNIRPRLLPEQCNDPEIYQNHLKITKGQLRFRFPPEPNGYLHIGHIKSMRINFQTAKKYNGLCYLRYDDTNPQTQSHQYIDNILSNVKWLGYQPDKITFASDYFEQMMEFALQLIKEGKAYVCDSPAAQIQKQRLNKIPSPFRNRSIQQSLACFPNLSEGQTLRLKLSPDAPNPTLRDPVIYRRKKLAHPRTGSRYDIYPMYDFAHCICDSLEHIDYSLCSLQFEVRRQLYYIILDLLRLYKPNVWEYSRVNVQSALISKRKIKALIEKGAISDWSDPRLLTIGGLINRGYTPTMLINFIDKVNSSRAGNQNVVQFSLLERQMKKELFKKAQKMMMVLKSRQAVIENLTEMETKQVPLFTEQARKQARIINLTKNIFIEESDELREGQLVVLKYFGVFEVSKCSPTLILSRKSEITVQNIKKNLKKFKILHWISADDSVSFPVTCFGKLLDKQNNVLEDSRILEENSRIPKQVIKEAENTQKYWQMERLGYFKFMSNGEFIRCVTL